MTFLDIFNAHSSPVWVKLTFCHTNAGVNTIADKHQSYQTIRFLSYLFTCVMQKMSDLYPNSDLPWIARNCDCDRWKFASLKSCPISFAWPTTNIGWFHVKICVRRMIMALSRQSQSRACIISTYQWRKRMKHILCMTRYQHLLGFNNTGMRYIHNISRQNGTVYRI